MARYLYSELALTLSAYKRCIETNNEEWREKHLARLKELCADYLPSGSGWDNGTDIDLDASHTEKIVLFGSFHHMNSNGYYDGWTDHTIVVTASMIHTLNLRIAGRNRNDIKEHLHELFYDALTQDIEPIELRWKHQANVKRLRSAFQFFSKHAGGIVGENAKTAIALARAEQWAKENELKFVWEYDLSPELGDHELWCNDARRIAAGYSTDGYDVGNSGEQCDHEVYLCYIDDSGKPTASLGSIVDPSAEYRRVIEAELALEAMPQR